MASAVDFNNASRTPFHLFHRGHEIGVFHIVEVMADAVTIEDGDGNRRKLNYELCQVTFDIPANCSVCNYCGETLPLPFTVRKAIPRGVPKDWRERAERPSELSRLADRYREIDSEVDCLERTVTVATGRIKTILVRTLADAMQERERRAAAIVINAGCAAGSSERLSPGGSSRDIVPPEGGFNARQDRGSPPSWTDQPQARLAR